MSFLQKIKNYFNKVDFDHSRSDITLYNYHPQFRVMLASVGIFFVNRDSSLRWVLPIFNTTIATTALIFSAITIWHAVMIKEYGFATETFSYFTVAVVTPLFYINVIKNTKTILKIAEDMNNNFIEVSALSPRYRVLFMKTQLMIWKLTFIWTTFLVTILQNYILLPIFFLVYQDLFGTQDEDTVRPLPLPLWLPGVDVFETPQYEIFFIFHVCASITCVQTVCVYICIFLHILLHCYALMDMIILDFEVIFDGLDESVVHLPRNDPRRVQTQTILSGRMKRIVIWHNLILKVVGLVSLIFGPTLVYQLGASSFALCLMTYQFVDKLEHGQLDVIFVLLTAGCLCQIAIPCYLGTIIRNKLYAVGNACWNCGWETTSLSRMLRSDIVIFILHCQIPVTIKFVGLPNVDLETFSSIVVSSYSYFNMLRQYSKK